MFAQKLVEDVSVQMLAAEHGDCILVRAAVARQATLHDYNPSSRGEFRILIDTGAGDESFQALRTRLSELEPQLGGIRWIDLAVFTHLDADHIGNARALLEESGLNLRFGDIWFNGYEQVGAVSRSGVDGGGLVKSFPQAESLSTLIGSSGLRHNRAFMGGPVVVPQDQDWLRIPLGSDESRDLDPRPVLTLLLPSVDRLSRLAAGWDRYRERFQRGESDVDPDLSGMHEGMLHKSDTSSNRDLTVDEMARLPLGEDRSLANGSSIAFILEHRGRHMLFLGDAYATDYEDAYLSWREAHPSAGAPSVVKVSHHGSRNNTTSRLAALGATNYFISTNGRHFGHPDDAILARLVVDAPEGVTPKLWFNYSTPTTQRWAELAQTDARFEVELPSSDDGAGCGISLCHCEDS